MKRAIIIIGIVLGIILVISLAPVCFIYVQYFYGIKRIERLIGPMRTDSEWRNLAENGDPTAQSTECALHGFKNDVDPAYYQKILLWCRHDADKGGVQEEYLLANLYASGRSGFPQDWEEAYFWYAVRIDDSHIPTTERDEAKNHLTDQQIKLVDERVAKWKENLCASNPTEHNARVERDWHCASMNK
jgi:hypothetical protein